MTHATVVRRRSFATAMATVLALAALPAGVATAALDPELTATLELRDGFIEYPLEPGTLHYFDEENQPLAVQVIDGCAVNDRYWLFGAGLSGVPLSLSILDETSGREVRTVLPPFEPGRPIGTVFEPDAFDICGDDVQVGGLPPLDALARYTSADERDPDVTSRLRLLSDGSETAYRRLSQADERYRLISRRPPIAAVDESSDFDRLFLIIEGRVPRSVEGIVFTGNEGMLPPRARLTEFVAKLPKSRVRRAYEMAENGREPNALIDDLGLRRVQRVHHIDLDFQSLGSEAYLAIAGWIREGGKPIEPPALVEERFTVELARADGSRTPLPLIGPFVGSDEAGTRWDYGTTEARVQIADNCRLTGSFWTWAVARTDEPLELVITDTVAGESVAQLLWTDRSELSSLSDTSALSTCS
jgi:hypothetical protein